MTEHDIIAQLEQGLERIHTVQHYGRVSAVSGMLVEVRGLTQTITVGGQCNILSTTNQIIPSEVVGFRDGKALVMPFGKLDGIGLGCRVTVSHGAPAIFPSDGWRGGCVGKSVGWQRAFADGGFAVFGTQRAAKCA
jgi:flagellum-specific ATP synthase